MSIPDAIAMLRAADAQHTALIAAVRSAVNLAQSAPLGEGGHAAIVAIAQIREALKAAGAYE